ncbi:hypothetical protein LCGC14_1938190 [marine sediment metagenome]|uniref:Uncharacterized protein n=1 Tax=marine sediment metagenome TaxID=412755 RepID=A0A0F9FL06_9ZZZZ
MITVYEESSTTTRSWIRDDIPKLDNFPYKENSIVSLKLTLYSKDGVFEEGFITRRNANTGVVVDGYSFGGIDELCELHGLIGDVLKNIGRRNG